jgi:hypothetical protein
MDFKVGFLPTIPKVEKEIAPLDEPTGRGEPLTNALVGLDRYRIEDYRAICHIERKCTSSIKNGLLKRLMTNSNNANSLVGSAIA